MYFGHDTRASYIRQPPTLYFQPFHQDMAGESETGCPNRRVPYSCSSGALVGNAIKEPLVPQMKIGIADEEVHGSESKDARVATKPGHDAAAPSEPALPNREDGAQESELGKQMYR